MKLKKKLITLIVLTVTLCVIGAAFAACSGTCKSGEHVYYYDSAAGETKCLINDDSVLPIKFEFDSARATAVVSGISDNFNLTDIVIPSAVQNGKTGKMFKVTGIAADAFSGCGRLASISFEDPLLITEIKSGTFANSGIKNFTVPENVTTVSGNAFYGCSSLTAVTFNGKLTEIGNRAFEGCFNLESVNIPASVTAIGMSAFKDCSALTTVNFDGGISLKTVAQFAFAGTAIAEIEIPAGVTAINSSAFKGCSVLERITVPDSLSALGSYAFDGCNSLNVIDFGGTLNEWNNMINDATQWNGNRTVTVEASDGNRVYKGTV